MKTISSILTLLTLLISAYSFSQNTYTIGGKTEITIAGTSNVHDWDEKAEAMTGSGGVTWNTDGTFNLTSLFIRIECKAIKSTHGSIMDNKTYDALKADKYPSITYKLTTPLNNIKPSATGTTISTTGDITIAGVTKTITMQVKITGTSNGLLSFEGTKGLKMSDFGVSPPTAFMGAMKVGDGVVVTFKTGFVKVAGNTSQSN